MSSGGGNYRPYGERLNNPSAEASNAIGFAGRPFDCGYGSELHGRALLRTRGRVALWESMRLRPTPEAWHGFKPLRLRQ
jgi:hypothetical protein